MEDQIYSIITYLNDSVHYNKSEINYLWQKQDWYYEGCLSFVHSHWLEFPPPSEKALKFTAAFYIIIMLVGIFGNLFVIIMILRCSSLQTSANILVTNLAISDLLMMLEMPLFIYHAMNNGMPLNKIECTIYGIIGGLSGTVSICMLSSIALDRYYIIIYPLNRTIAGLRSKIFASISWMYGLIFALIPLVISSTGGYVPEGYLISCSFNYLSTEKDVRIFIFCFFVAAWLIPFFIITGCYTNIIRAVKKTQNISKKMGNMALSAKHCREEKQRETEIKMAFIILSIIVMWFVAWTPYAIVALLGIVGEKELITPLVSMIPALFCKSASCIDPFIYAVSNQNFKLEFKKLICKTHPKKEKIIWTTNISRRSNFQQSEKDVEEFMVVTTNKIDTNKEFKMSIKNRENKSNEENMINTGKRNYTSRFFQPNFSNRSSSLRNVVRYLNKRKEHSFDDIDFNKN